MNNQPTTPDAKTNDAEDEGRFPQRLRNVIDDKDHDAAVWWNEDGCTFGILPDLFEPVLEKFFNGNKFESFTRKLNRWGFRRVTPNQNNPAGCLVFRCKFFTRDAPNLMTHMTGTRPTRAKVPAIAIKLPAEAMGAYNSQPLSALAGLPTALDRSLVSMTNTTASSHPLTEQAVPVPCPTSGALNSFRPPGGAFLLKESLDMLSADQLESLARIKRRRITADSGVSVATAPSLLAPDRRMDLIQAHADTLRSAEEEIVQQETRVAAAKQRLAGKRAMLSRMLTDEYVSTTSQALALERTSMDQQFHQPYVQGLNFFRPPN